MQITDERLDSLSALGGDISDLVTELRTLRDGVRSTPTVPPVSPLRVGNNVLIRTVTMIQTGHIESLTDAEVVLSDGAWIADTGRFFTALKTGIVNEVEPFPHSVSVSRGSIVDVTDWPHKLPRLQK